MKPFEEDFTDSHIAYEPDKQAMLVGGVFDLDDNKVWRFGETGSSHPGACIDYSMTNRTSTLSKGTSRHPGKRLGGYIQVEPDANNNLKCTTYFELIPRTLRSHKLEVMSHQRRIGTLSAEDLLTIQTRMMEQFAKRDNSQDSN